MKFFDFVKKIFKADKASLVLSLGKKALKLFVGRMAGELLRIAREEVQNAEASGFDGARKFQIASGAIKNRIRGMKGFAISLAIEVVVAALNASQKKD